MSSSMRSYSLLAPGPAPALLLLTAAAAFSIVACRGRQSERATTDSAAHASTSAGNVVPASDTTGTVSATLDAIGPGIQVTPTDEHNVSRAIDLKLTDDNWAKFLRAADSVAALRARDAAVRQHLDAEIVGAKEDDAGLKWLDAEPKVSAAINNAGLTTKDYFRLGITTAAAMRYMNDPKAAPPTPAGRENAEFVRNHQSDIAHLREISRGGPGVVKAR